MNKLTDQIIPTIAAIEPCYGEGGGNATRVYTMGGDCFTDRRRLKSLLEAVLRHYGTTLPIVRDKYGKLLSRKHYVPLPLGRNMVLFQYKARSPQFLHDGASGFINLFALQDIAIPCPAEKKQGVNSLVHLSGGHQLSSFLSLKTMQERKTDANTALLYYEKVHGAYSQDPVMVRESGLIDDSVCFITITAPNWKKSRSVS